MTLQGLTTVLAEIPDDIPVSKYYSEVSTVPRVVWNETGIYQDYGSNRADQPVRVRCVAELVTYPDCADRWKDIVKVFRRHGIPVQCTCGIDGDTTQYVTYDFEIVVDVDEEDLDDE